MKMIQKFLSHIFIDGLSGMGLGLFSTLIIGTIMKQVGDLIGGDIGMYISAFALMAQRLTGAGIGVGVAYKFKESVYVTLSALMPAPYLRALCLRKMEPWCCPGRENLSALLLRPMWELSWDI